MSAGLIIMLVMAYVGIGGLTGAAIDMQDNSIMCASFIFWPLIVLIYAGRGLIKILGGK